MLEKDPSNYSLITYAWVFLLAIFGGVVNWLGKVRRGAARYFNVAELLGEMATSAFAGIITFWLCEAADLHPLITAALIGISGHMGSRAIFKLERFIENRLK